MKNYASNRLYLAYNRYVSQSVVKINDDGMVLSYSSLMEETAFTEWIGGVIFLSDKDSFTLPANFKELSSHITDVGNQTYAWHISHFDFQHEELTPISIIRRL